MLMTVLLYAHRFACDSCGMTANVAPATMDGVHDLPPEGWEAFMIAVTTRSPIHVIHLCPLCKAQPVSNFLSMMRNHDPVQPLRLRDRYRP